MKKQKIYFARMRESDEEKLDEKFLRWIEAEALADHFKRAAERYRLELVADLAPDDFDDWLDPQDIALAALKRRNRGPLRVRKSVKRSSLADELPKPSRNRPRN